MKDNAEKESESPANPGPSDNVHLCYSRNFSPKEDNDTIEMVADQLANLLLDFVNIQEIIEV